MQHPLAVLIGALGGEGGGVLSDWVVEVAKRSGYLVQSTSIPGVAQRTGATTYYIELIKAPKNAARLPVMALTPTPGHVDVVLASELLEAARAVLNGMVTPERTTVISSVHRIFAIGEKMGMGDGRYDPARAEAVVRELSAQALLFDMEAVAKKSGAVISSVMFGALAGSGALPFKRKAYEDVIRDGGVAVERNLHGFALGFEAARGPGDSAVRPDAKRAKIFKDAGSADELIARAEGAFAAASQSTIREGVKRLADFQDRAYAALYLDRLVPVRDALMAASKRPDWGILSEAARHLALRMSYEDVMRVADLKTRASRHERVRTEVGAKIDQPLVIVEYLKPGLEEFAAFMPNFIGAPALRLARRYGLMKKLHIGFHIKSTNVSGFLVMKFLAKLAIIRRGSWRYKYEQANIERWLAAIRAAIALDRQFAAELIECARLVKGYGSTYDRGMGNFNTIMDRLVDPALKRKKPDAARLKAACAAALADPDGKSLDAVLEAAPARAGKKPAKRASGKGKPVAAE